MSDPNIPECYQTLYDYYYDKEEPMSNTQKKVEKHAKLVAYLKKKLVDDADVNKLYELLELERELAILEE